METFLAILSERLHFIILLTAIIGSSFWFAYTIGTPKRKITKKNSCLGKKFEKRMRELPPKWREVGCHAGRFVQSVNSKGGVDAAKNLIEGTTTGKEKGGFIALKKINRLDLSVEALVYQNTEFHRLFADDVIEKARQKLIEHGYRPNLI